MTLTIDSTVALSNGVEMPRLGLGVFKAEDGREVEQAVAWAIQAGYRSIDTAAFYHNEGGVGRAIRDSGMPRESIFVTTKIWNDDQRRGATQKAFDDSLARLGLDYIDLYLVHWPVAGYFKQTWQVLETIYRSGRARAIGVSNFMVHHLEQLLEGATVPPVSS
ncbi:MAG: aldo/keto reductase, partial [Candidatus Promineifilaceae bacterium]